MKKIGKAKADSKAGVWIVSERQLRFLMNKRLVDRNPEVKSLKAFSAKHSGKRPPSKSKRAERDAYFERMKELRTKSLEVVEQIYAETLKESFDAPVPLVKEKSDKFNRADWSYGLYEGVVYEFDQPNYSSEKMLEEINTYNNCITK